jgi:hypothetical protein
MSRELTRKTPPPARRFEGRNTMAFPRELREAIPDLHAGRVLELDSINGKAANTALFGSFVMLKLVVKETGNLKGTYVVRMDLQPAAARELAATLVRLADEAGQG